MKNAWQLALVAGAVLAVSATFIVPVVSSGMYRDFGDSAAHRYEMMAWTLLYYFVQYVVIFFFNSALVGAAMIRSPRASGRCV